MHRRFLFVALVSAGCGSEVTGAPFGESGAGGAGGANGVGGRDATGGGSTPEGARTAGAPCDANGSLRCGEAADAGAILTCLDGRYERAGTCGDDGPCQDVQGADAVVCGTTFVGLEGAPCVGAATQVCALDREVVLGCEGGSWAPFIHCGPVRCVDVPAEAGGLCSGAWCEGCSYTLGDRCAFPAGTVNCSTDGAQVVRCEGGIVTLAEDCGATGTTCAQRGSAITCE